MKLTRQTQRAIQLTIFAGLGLFYLGKITDGSFFWYLSERFLALTVAASVLLLAIPAALLLGRKAFEPTDHVHDHAHDHDHEPPGAPHTEPAHLSPLRLGVVALPLLLGVIIPARPLSAGAVANKELNNTAALTVAASVKLDDVDAVPAAERNVLDWVRAFNYATNPASLKGQPADVVGFVYRDERLPEGQFLVGRYAVTHCVAEAVAVGVVVEWPGEIPAVNTWVQVKGAVTAARLADKTIPKITAEALEPVEVPSRPYLYP